MATATAKRKRKEALKANRQKLIDAGIDFTEHNNGYHLVVKCNHGRVFDCYPSTEKWMKRGSKSKQGFDELIKEIGKWGVKQNGCLTCGQLPYLEDTGMCAACTFGEAQAQQDLINGEMEGAVWN